MADLTALVGPSTKAICEKVLLDSPLSRAALAAYAEAVGLDVGSCKVEITGIRLSPGSAAPTRQEA